MIIRHFIKHINCDIPNNLVIYYTSTGWSIVLPNAYDFGAGVVENTYTNKQGMMIFNGDVVRIGYQAFWGCSSLTSVTIPNSVTSIGSFALYNCSSLTSITCEATTPPTSSSSNNLPNVTAVYVPAESVDAYKNATNWSYYADQIQPIP